MTLAHIDEFIKVLYDFSGVRPDIVARLIKGETWLDIYPDSRREDDHDGAGWMETSSGA